MDKKILLLLASTVIVAGSPFDINTAEAKIVEHNNGAIIRQLPRDNTLELLSIEQNYSKPEQRFEKQIKLIKYYEKKLDYERSDALFDELIGMLKEANDKEYNAFIDRLNYWAKETTVFYPNSSRFYYRFYLWEKNFGSIDAAIANLRKAIEIEKTNPQYHYEYAQYVLTNNEYEKAIRILRTLKSQYPRNIDYRIALAKAYTQAGQYNDAIREYRVATAFDPDNNDTVIALNELTDYTKTAKYSGENKPFYDPMTAVKPMASASGEKVVAFGSQAEPAQTPSQKAVSKAAAGKANYNRKAVNSAPVESKQNVNNPYTLVTSSQQNTAQEPQNAVAQTSQSAEQPAVMQTQKAQKATAPSQKRLMVSYVNGRKVVKIVNINTEVDARRSLQEASSTFSSQLNSSNAGYSNAQQSLPAENQVQFKKSTADSAESVANAFEKTTQNTQNAYSLKSDKDYVSGGQTNAVQQAQNVKPAQTQQTQQTTQSQQKAPQKSYRSGNGHNQLIVTYKNGKKSVQLANPDGTPVKDVRPDMKQSKQSNEKFKGTVDKSKIQEKASLKGEKDNTDAYIKASEYATQKQFQEAIDVLQKVQPATLRSLTAIAACYNDLGKTDEAIEYYNKADSISPNNTQILYSIGYLYFTKNEIAMAKDYVKKALEIDPSNQNALRLNAYMTQQDSNVATNQAVKFMNQGNYAEARKILTKSLQTNQNDFQSYYYLGHIDYATQKYEDATKAFELAIKYNPDYALSYYSIGLAFDKLKDFNKSLAAYQQFVNMETDDNKYTQYAKTRISTIRAKQ